MSAPTTLRLVGFTPFFSGCQQHPYDGHQEQSAAKLDPRHDGLGASHQPIEKILHALCAPPVHFRSIERTPHDLLLPRTPLRRSSQNASSRSTRMFCKPASCDLPIEESRFGRSCFIFPLLASISPLSLLTLSL